MEPYFRLNNLIHSHRTIDQIRRHVQEKDISGESFNSFENCCDVNLPCPLGQAALYGRCDVMKALFTVGFDPNALHGCYLGCDLVMCPWTQCSAMHLATHGGHLSVIRLLVEECHVDVNTEDSDKFTALHQAILSESCRPETRLAIVKYLVEAGADFERSRRGIAPIHFAACDSIYDVCEYLLSKGAKVINETNSTGLPVAFAAYRGNDLCSHLLLRNAKGLNVHEVFSGEETLLHICSGRGYTDSIKLLCSLGSNPDAQDRSGQTALHHAVKVLGTEKEIRPNILCVLHFLIIERNVSLHLTDLDTETPFDKAVLLKDIAVVELFLSAGYQSTVASPQRVQNTLEAIASENEYIQKRLSSPKKLQDLCCFRVRCVLCQRLASAVESLPVPNKMKDYIKLKHVHIPK